MITLTEDKDTTNCMSCGDRNVTTYRIQSKNQDSPTTYGSVAFCGICLGQLYDLMFAFAPHLPCPKCGKRMDVHWTCPVCPD